METCGKEDHFNRLPDDLIISHILGKIQDAKCLLSCSMLSKRFAFLVLQSQTLSCTIRRWVPFYKDISTLNEPPSFTKIVLRFFSKPVSFLRGLFWDSYPSCCDEKFMLPLMRFIMEFMSLKSINVEVAFSDLKHKTSSHQCPILKWKLEYKPKNSGTFVLMLAKSLAVATGVEEVDNDEADVLSARDTCKHISILQSAGQDARLRYMVFEKIMASQLPNQLQTAVITDSRKQGKVVLEEEKLVEMRNENVIHKDTEMIVRMWRAKVLSLPLSGYVMKVVILHVLKLGTDADVDGCESIAEGAFEGEGVFAEAATKLLKRKPASEERARIIIRKLLHVSAKVVHI